VKEAEEFRWPNIRSTIGRHTVVGSAMKLRVTHFKTPRIGLKELEPFVRNTKHLYSGKPFDRFGDLRSRELLGNWLICAVLNAGSPTASYTFTSDPQGGDGIIYDTETETGWPTEHVLVPRTTAEEIRDIPALILAAVSKKQKKGAAAYARGKVLVVFLDAGLGEWFPNGVAKQLPSVDFKEVWVVGLHGEVTDEYTYGVVQLDISRGNAPMFSAGSRAVHPRDM
jgi:hypothetical protein